MIVAVHQPNFLPWLGWFDKLARADTLVLLDNVAMRRSGSSWANRVQVLVQGRASWLTVPVEAGSAGRARIDTARIAEDGKWRERLRRTLQHAYGRCPGYADVMPALEEMFAAPVQGLCEFNLIGIRAMARLLGLDDRRMVRASELNAEGTATDLLIACVRAAGGTAYLAGGGASGYQEDDKFAAAGLQLIHQSFAHPVYRQGATEAFVSGLSAVDALMQLGPEGAANLLRPTVVAG